MCLRPRRFNAPCHAAQHRHRFACNTRCTAARRSPPRLPHLLLRQSSLTPINSASSQHHLQLRRYYSNANEHFFFRFPVEATAITPLVEPRHQSSLIIALSFTLVTSKILTPPTALTSPIKPSPHRVLAAAPSSN